MPDNITEFISRRFPTDCNWKGGNCYYFAVILEARFPGGTICYDLVMGHFVYLYKGKYYDWEGEVIPLKEPVPWNGYEITDATHKRRIERYCIK